MKIFCGCDIGPHNLNQIIIVFPIEISFKQIRIIFSTQIKYRRQDNSVLLSLKSLHIPKEACIYFKIDEISISIYSFECDDTNKTQAHIFLYTNL